MNQETAQPGSHLCPDCQTNDGRGHDRFGQPMPCPGCVVGRLVKALHADLDEPRARGMPLEPTPVFLEKFRKTLKVATGRLRSV